jgi:hypothetical protein
MVKDHRANDIFDPSDPGKRVTARLFVDASETGRLVRLSGHHVGTVGREDQNPDQLQMAATLMFKMKGIDARAAVVDYRLQGRLMSDKGSFQLWAGHEMNVHPSFIRYNEDSAHFKLKPYNAGEDGYSGLGVERSKEIEYWMNMLLIYNVDARKAIKDIGSDRYPQDGDGIDPETARRLAIEEIKRPEFIALLRQLRGLESAELVMENGEPVVGEILYLRESIHTADVADRENRIYRFALDKEGVTGGDAKYYAHRIGLGYYPFDSNSYKKGEPLSNPLAQNPWYIPYEVLLHPRLTNVLIPGYAANMDSFAWTAMRVYPNLIVLGDAAGVAAGLALQGKFRIHGPSEQQIALLQQTLVAYKAILDK